GHTPTGPVVTAPLPGFHWSTGEIIDFAGQATDPQDGPLPPSQLTWQIILHHCHAVGDCHTHFITSVTGSSGSVDGPEHEYPSYLELQLVATDLPPADWFDTDWSRRRRIAFDNTAQAEDLHDFPVLVELDPSRIDYAQTLPGGRDLRFTDRFGNPVPYEIEQWNPSGVSTVWVDVPLIHASSAADFIWMYYGNPTVTQSAEDSASVWRNQYAAVWHLTDLLDSTANANDGTDFGSSPTAGFAAGARSFNGGAWINMAADPSLAVAGSLTMEAWIQIANTNQGNEPRILDKKLDWTAHEGYDFEYQPAANNVTALGSGTDWLRADRVDLDTRWHYLVATLSPQAVGTIYVDGVNLTTDSTVSPVVAGTQALLIGSRGGIDEFFLGSIDELRISATQRSAAWISAQYRSMTQTFASFGPEHTQGTLSAMTSLNLDPLAVQLTFDSTPQQGLQLTAGTTTAPPPLAATLLLG